VISLQLVTILSIDTAVTSWSIFHVSSPWHTIFEI